MICHDHRPQRHRRHRVPKSQVEIDREDGTVAMPGMAGNGEGVDLMSWTCFHCGETFVARWTAAEHFGPDEIADPACRIDVAKFREMEALHLRHLQEDSDSDRRYHAQQADHAEALRRAEEEGYARGLRDSHFTEMRSIIDDFVTWLGSFPVNSISIADIKDRAVSILEKT